MRTFGLTGGIGTGKSTVAAMLRVSGLPVLDADQVARDVVAPGGPALAEIAQAFEGVVVDGQLDRRALRARIMADPADRRRLEAITHPRIAEVVEAWIAARRSDVPPPQAAGVEAALMVETGSWRRYDGLIVVSCDRETQITRVMARDQVDRASAEAVLAAQLPLAEKVAVATWVVRNDGDLPALQVQVDAVANALHAPD